MKRFYSQCAQCGQGTRKADTFRCAGCQQTFCPICTVFYFDSSNEAITRHSPPFCRACYIRKYEK